MILRTYDRLLDLFAALAGAIFGFLFLMIIYDVTSRALGVGVVTWVDAMTEYALLYSTALAAPWLLRERGHVCIEFLRHMVSARVRAFLEKLVYTIGLVVSLIMVWYSFPVIQQSWGQLDIRSFEMPRWLLYAPLTVSFGLMAIGFARFLLGWGTLYAPLQPGDEGF